MGVRSWIGMLALVVCGVAQASCPPAGETPASLLAMKAAQWRVSAQDDEAARQSLALRLLDCLADPDPVLRDDLAFEALSAWMRGKQLTQPTLQDLRVRLLAMLAGPPDTVGFRQPFAALTLAEVARVDRLASFLSVEERGELVARAAAYLAGGRDYRGFDAREGWRHGVAHGADLMLQLSLNPLLQRAQAEVMLAAIASQVLPAGGHFYLYGEPTRLMAPVFYLARRGWLQADDWQAWFDGLTARAAHAGPPTHASLAARHNLGAFLAALYASVQEATDEGRKTVLLPGLRKAMKAMD